MEAKRKGRRKPSPATLRSAKRDQLLIDAGGRKLQVRLDALAAKALDLGVAGSGEKLTQNEAICRALVETYTPWKVVR